MKKKNTRSYIINRILDEYNNDSSLYGSYLKLINIGMTLYYKENELIKSLFSKIEVLDEWNNLLVPSSFSDNILVSFNDNHLTFFIKKTANSLEILETLTCEINKLYSDYENTNFINEYCNILKAEEIIKIILDIQDIIDDNKILDLYDSLNILSKKNYKCCIKQISVNLVRPLYETMKELDYSFKDILKDEGFWEINEMFSKESNVKDYYLFAELYRKIRNLINCFCLKLKME